MVPSLTEVTRRVLRPFPAVDGRLERAWTATQPSPRVAAHAIGWQFIAAALVAAVIATVAPSAVVHPGFLYGIAAAALLVGARLRFSLHAASASLEPSLTIGVALVGGIVAIARPMELTPLLFLWPLLLSAHFALPGRLAANVGLALGLLALAIGTSADAATPVPSLAIFSAITLGATVAYRRVRAEAARLFGELEEVASRDVLTGALNRGAFERAFHAWVGNGMNRRLESSLLLMDIDGLRRLNAEHGHEFGDDALRHLTSIVGGLIRETDAFGRLEGEEFGLLFPATSGTDALVAAERIRSAVARRSAECGAAFTISIGVTGAHAFSDPWAAAQRALRLAKDAGANRVVLAETETEAEAEFDDFTDLDAVPVALAELRAA